MQLPKLSAVRPNKTWLALGAALAIGIIAAVVARSYLSSRLAEIEAHGKGRMINLMVAKQELRKGELISEDTVAVRPIPAEYVHSQAISPDDFERLEGQALAFPVKPGEMILWSLLEGKKAPTFSTRVAAGRRAITVPVDEINSISGMLEPGDTVDLVNTVDSQNKKHTFVLLQSVPVLATGQRSVDDPKSGEKRLYSTVTLDTTPDQAQRIIRARESGKLTALLRNPQDKIALAVSDGEPSPSNDAIAGEPEGVPVIYGGRSGTLPSPALRLSQFARPEARNTEMGEKPVRALAALNPLPAPTNAGPVDPAEQPTITLRLDSNRPTTP